MPQLPSPYGEGLAENTDTNVSQTSKTEYCGNYIYENGCLKRILTPEGYIQTYGSIPLNSMAMWSYKYLLKDHLGNTRMELIGDDLSKKTTTLQPAISMIDYYPFGLTQIGSYDSGMYLYNGKEYDGMNGLNEYDYGARWRDPTVGNGWPTVDPLAENNYSISPYAYCMGNPVRFIDPNGEDVYLFYWVKSDNENDNAMFFQAALTRATDALKNMKEGDAYKVSAVEDLGTLGSKVEKDVKELSPKYGGTREFGLWSHSGKLDGPRGSVTTSGPDGVSGNQMSVEGWGKIKFNWATGSVKAGFYGCNAGRDPDGDGPKASFTTNLSAQSNFRDVNVWGQTSASYPSKFTNVRENDKGMIDSKFGYPTYMVGAGSLDVTGRFIPTSSPANPMRVSVNGKGSSTDSFGRFIYQPGSRK